jgi:hypothetical protein
VERVASEVPGVSEGSNEACLPGNPCENGFQMVVGQGCHNDVGTDAKVQESVKVGPYVGGPTFLDQIRKGPIRAREPALEIGAADKQ